MQRLQQAGSSAHSCPPCFFSCPLQVEKALAIPPSMQKLMYKGLLKNDTDTLEKVRLKAHDGTTATHCMRE